MALIGNTWPTLADVAKSLDARGMVAEAINMLTQKNDILDDIPWIEANNGTTHRTTYTVSEPTVYWRRINEGVLPSKSGRAQLEETSALMEGWSEIDEELLIGNGSQMAAFRAQEDAGFVSSMGKELARTLIYGNAATAPTKFTGFATRFSDVNYGESGTGLKDGSVVDAGGTGSDNTSIWLIGWGNQTVHGIYPQGSVAGLQANDLGLETKHFADGSLQRVWRTQFKWKVGLAVRDWRYVVRIANIDVSNLLSGTSAADLITLMIKAMNRLPDRNNIRPVFYANRAVATMLDIQSLDRAQNTLTLGDVFGRQMMTARGIPIRTVDALLTTEAQLT